ncbi:MAG: MarR family transcriptional regulator [Caulobacterales bacterium]|jgi:DNA-binding MarR family transcriptional regulator|nr:MarR family transcriptional regulator [Caulobacterales bacterium]
MKKSESLPSGLALRAAFLLERLARLVRAGDHAGGLAPAQWEALRYLARANRFSRTPAALADYLGATRGTVSQTLIALVGKGLVRKSESSRDRRSVELTLTSSGVALLEHEALKDLARDIDASGEADGLARGLESALHQALVRGGGRAFGVCRTCRHFRPGGRGAKAGKPHHCTLLDEPLADADANLVCFEHT